MNIIKLVASSSFITINKNLIKIFGLDAAAIVGMFASIASYNDNNWFYATYERIEEELGLKKSVAAKAIEKICEAEILIEKFEGIPCRKHFKFQEVRLLHYLSCENQTTSRAQEEPQAGDISYSQGVRKSNYINKNKDNNKTPSLLVKPEIAEIIEREKLNLDLEIFYKWYEAEMRDKGLKGSLLNVMRSMAEKPRNQIKNATMTELKEVTDLRRKIKSSFTNQLDYSLYFGGCDIDLKNLTIFVKNPKALEYQELLNELNLKIKLKK